MSERQELPDEDTLDLAERVYDALLGEAALSHLMRREEADTRVSLKRLYTYLTETDAEDRQLESSLDSDSALRADLRRLTEKVAAFHVPKLAAAATGQVTRREAPGCRIRLEPSRAEPTQTYVIISLDDPGRYPRWLAVFSGDDRCRRIALPEPQDGLVQLILDHDSELLAALYNPDSDIFIDG